MSILRDLDPQNTSIHHNVGAGGDGKKFAWIIALVLFSSGLFWLAYGDQFRQNLAATDPALTPESNISRSPTAPTMAQDYLTPVPATGTALIRNRISTKNEQNTNKTNNESGPQVGHTGFEKARSEPTEHSTRTPIRQAGSINGDQYRQTNRASENKSSRATIKRSSTSNGLRVAKGEKSSTERDIDIITAIVK